MNAIIMNNIRYIINYIIDTFLRYIYCIIQTIQRYYQLIRTSFGSTTTIQLTLDNGKQILIGRLIAEGGYSYVYEAYDRIDTTGSNSTTGSTTTRKQQQQQQEPTKYALKRIQCYDTESITRCRYEINVHRSVSHPCLMPLLGSTIVSSSSLLSNKNSTEPTSYCYMLFPFVPYSLRDDMNRKMPHLQQHSNNNNNNNNNNTTSLFQQHSPYSANTSTTSSSFCPWTNEIQPLQLFYQICCAIQVLHDNNYTHRDIKLENILLLQQQSNDTDTVIPIVMDFGSAGPITVPISSRRQILSILDTAMTQTTISYRPPELFDGGIRYVESVASAAPRSISSSSLQTTTAKNDIQQIFDYRPVDVWMLGCVLFGMLYGIPPSECEFRRSDGTIHITEANHLSILRNIPKPFQHTRTYQWYSTTILESYYTILLQPMLQQDPNKRCKLPIIIQSIEQLLHQFGASIPNMNGSGLPTPPVSITSSSTFHHFNGFTTGPNNNNNNDDFV